MENSDFGKHIEKQPIEKQAKFHVFFLVDFLKNTTKSIENKVSRKILPETPKMSICRPFWPPKTLPKPLQNREKIDEKSKLTTKAKK